MFNISSQQTVTAFINNGYCLVIHQYDGKGNVNEIIIGRTHIKSFISGLEKETKDLDNE